MLGNPPPITPELLVRDAEIKRTESAQQQLALQKADYSKACWRPPSGTNYVGALDMTVDFDASGKELRRSPRFRLPFGRDATLLDCVKRTKLPLIQIDAPGKPLTLLLRLDLP